MNTPRVHVGPYLKCRNEKVEKPSDETGCLNLSCKSFDIPYSRVGSPTKFCSECGGPLALLGRVTKQPKVCWYEASEAIKGALHCTRAGSDEFLYWLPNVRRNAPREFTVEDEGVADLSTFLPLGDITWFDRAFRDEIGKLEAMYGEDNVDMKWGVVAYYS